MPVSLKSRVQDLFVVPGSTSWAGAVGLVVTVGVAYFLAAQLSLLLLTKPEGVAVFWPAAARSPRNTARRLPSKRKLGLRSSRNWSAFESGRIARNIAVSPT